MIEFKSHSGIYTLTTKQSLPIKLDKAWDFFSSPKNLGKITPKQMGFQITSDTNSKMYPGQIISYKVGIIPGIKSNWITEITHVNDKKHFVDEQRFGPYAMWHHEHFFEETKDGILMTDKVSYKLPFGFLGQLVHFLIKFQLKKIFQHRFTTLDSFFK